MRSGLYDLGVIARGLLFFPPIAHYGVGNGFARPSECRKQVAGKQMHRVANPSDVQVACPCMQM